MDSALCFRRAVHDVLAIIGLDRPLTATAPRSVYYIAGSFHHILDASLELTYQKDSIGNVFNARGYTLDCNTKWSGQPSHKELPSPMDLQVRAKMARTSEESAARAGNTLILA